MNAITASRLGLVKVIVIFCITNAITEDNVILRY